MYSRIICNFVLFFPSLLKCVYLHNLKKFKGNKKINMGKKVEKTQAIRRAGLPTTGRLTIMYSLT